MRSSTPDPPSTGRTLLRNASSRLLRSLSSSSKTPTMATTAPPVLHSPEAREEQVMDTRTPSPLHRTHSTADMSDYKPDLSQEVAMLSTKLVNAINFQTTLDDQLQQSRHELEQSRRQASKLQAEKKYLDDMIRDGVLVKMSDMDPVVQSLRAELFAERNAREAAERSKKQTEAELENLTSALFEEANTMVAAARKESEAADKRTTQLRSKLGDTEVLLTSQQEQLQDLKLTMERMSERGDNDTIARNSVPSTPIHPPSGLFDGLPMSSSQSAGPELPPEHPLFFSSLLVPVLRSDVTAYNDFQELLLAARKAAGHFRSTSHGTPQDRSSSNSLGITGQFTGSSPNLPGAFSFSTSSSPQTSQSFSPPMIPLKDSRFYKRTLMEDIEPTLRLDLAPGLSFLSRRGVLSSLLQGSLVVEPFVPGGKYVGPIYACALCGESRKTEQYVRKHRFRTSEEERAQRYPLCDYCLGRIRASGDFMTFLRMVRDGHWRADTDDEQKSAWEESVRLRERMFWARVGGGVVPASTLRTATPSTSAVKSPRQSLDSSSSERKPVELALDEAEPSSPSQASKRVSLDQKLVEVFQRHRKSMSISRVLPDLSTPMDAQLETVSMTEARPIEEAHTSEHSGTQESHGQTAIDAITASDDDQSATQDTQTLEVESSSTDGDRPATQDTHTLEVKSPSTDDAPRTSRSSTTSLKPIVTSLDVRRASIDSKSRPASPESQRTSSSTNASRSPERKQTGVLARVREMEAQSK